MVMPLKIKAKPVFFVDAMLGNIAKKLRLMGFDSSYDSQIADDDLINFAIKENRIIVSCDSELIRKSSKLGIRSILVQKKEEHDQLLELIQSLNLKKVEISGDNARCPLCNSETESIKKEVVSYRVPKLVLEKNEKFWICKNCDKIFWEGSHIMNLQKLVRELNER